MGISSHHHEVMRGLRAEPVSLMALSGQLPHSRCYVAFKTQLARRAILAGPQVGAARNSAGSCATTTKPFQNSIYFFRNSSPHLPCSPPSAAHVAIAAPRPVRGRLQPTAEEAAPEGTVRRSKRARKE